MDLKKEDQNAPHSMGTTIIGVTYNGGVVLGADSRTSTGVYVANRASDKITQLTDNVYLCRSGSAADSQIVSDYVRYFLHQHTIQLGQPATVKVAANLCRLLSYNNKNFLETGLIVGGWDKYEGGKIYGVPLGGTIIEQPFAIGGTLLFGLSAEGNFFLLFGITMICSLGHSVLVLIMTWVGLPTRKKLDMRMQLLCRCTVFMNVLHECFVTSDLQHFHWRISHQDFPSPSRTPLGAQVLGSIQVSRHGSLHDFCLPVHCPDLHILTFDL